MCKWTFSDIVLILQNPVWWQHRSVNSLSPGRLKWKFSHYQAFSVIDGWGISCEIGLRWMPLDLNDKKSTLVQVMAWCRQATSHYLSQCWPRSLSLYGITRPQWVKSGTIIDVYILQTWNDVLALSTVRWYCNIKLLQHLEVAETSIHCMFWRRRNKFTN